VGFELLLLGRQELDQNGQLGDVRQFAFVRHISPHKPLHMVQAFPAGM
jgi:hypothetical protein